MVIKFEGIEFDSVKELVEYKQMVGYIEPNKTQEPKQSFVPENVSKNKLSFGRGGKQWSKEEDAIVINNFEKMSINRLARLFPDRTIDAVKSRITTLNLRKQKIQKPVQSKKMKSNSWTAEEDALLYKYYNTMSNPILVRTYLPNRTIRAVESRAYLKGISDKRVKKAGSSNKPILTKKITANKHFSKEEIDIIKYYYNKYRINNRISKKGMKILHQQLPHRGIKVLSSKITRLGLRKKEERNYPMKKDNDNTEEPTKKADYMFKKKAFVPSDYDTTMINKAQKSFVDDKYLKFPKIYPLSDEANAIFEQMLIHMIANESKINYIECRSNLTLSNDLEWTGRLWGEFCQQVNRNKKAICSALNCKESKFKIFKEGWFDYIGYGKGTQ